MEGKSEIGMKELTLFLARCEDESAAPIAKCFAPILAGPGRDMNRSACRPKRPNEM